MQIEIESNCPLDKNEDGEFNPCRQTKCGWFVKLRGTHNGSEIDEYGCAMAWLPILLVENAQQSRQTGAAVESFRNQVDDARKALMSEQPVKITLED